MTVRTRDVYGEDEDAGFLGSAANRLHLKTRQDVIRELLLFEEGDPFDPERLEETERNLRKLPFIRTASVEAGEPHDGRVDVEVVTQDSWSTEPGLSFGSRGGGSKTAIEFTERNLLGRGWEVQYRYEQNPDRSGQSIRLRDPSLFGPYWRAEARYASNSDGSEQSFHLERPFVSTTSGWSMLMAGSQVEREETLYASGLAVSHFAASHDAVELGYGWSLGHDSSSAHRISTGFTLQRDTFGLDRYGDAEAILPVDRDYRYLWAQYDYVSNDYLELDYVDRAEVPEDFNLGTELSVRLGVSPSLLGVDATTGLVDARLSRGFETGDHSVLLADLGFSSRIGSVNRNGLASVGLQHLTRFETRRPQTTLFGVHYDRGWDLDRDRQLFADGENGLRGYRLHAFEGDQRLIVNAEHRIYLGHEVFNILSPGIVGFIDAGSIGYGPDGIGWSSTKFDAGVGLILGLSRSGHNTVRIDLAHAFSDDPLGRSPWVISVSGGRSF